MIFLWRQNNPEVNYSPHSFGHVLYKDCLLKHVIEEKIGGRIDKEEEVSSYWIALRKS
jgi:hypothetical protein